MCSCVSAPLVFTSHGAAKAWTCTPYGGGTPGEWRPAASPPPPIGCLRDAGTHHKSHPSAHSSVCVSNSKFYIRPLLWPKSHQMKQDLLVWPSAPFPGHRRLDGRQGIVKWWEVGGVEERRESKGPRLSLDWTACLEWPRDGRLLCTKLPKHSGGQTSAGTPAVCFSHWVRKPTGCSASFGSCSTPMAAVPEHLSLLSTWFPVWVLKVWSNANNLLNVHGQVCS